MDAQTFLAQCVLHRKRTHVIGDLRHGVIAGLDLEGRLYAVHQGHVVSRVNKAAISGLSGPAGWLNPGGDGLWPAPEGTRLGYLYATGAWGVPPAIAHARYQVVTSTANSALIQADLDLINAQSLGVPVRAERAISVTLNGKHLVVTNEESFTYRGVRHLSRAECLLAPWSLSQFDCGDGCETVFPDSGADCVWDLYDSSTTHRTLRDGLWHIRTDGSARFQLGLSAAVPWIEFRRPDGLRVRRQAQLAAGLSYVDIGDRSPHLEPDSRGCRYSIYSDASGFLEIEAAGGMPEILTPGTRLATTVTTTFSL